MTQSDVSHQTMLVIATSLNILILSQSELLNCQLTQSMTVENGPLVTWERVPELIVDVSGQRYLFIIQIVQPGQFSIAAISCETIHR